MRLPRGHSLDGNASAGRARPKWPMGAGAPNSEDLRPTLRIGALGPASGYARRDTPGRSLPSNRRPRAGKPHEFLNSYAYVGDLLMETRQAAGTTR